MGAEDLVEVLKEVAPFDHPWVDRAAVGPMEDAALLRPESGPALVFTVDFITPIVDDPYDFGAIAAANALSDVYAMGASPRVALAISGFPDEILPRAVLTRIFAGGRDKAAEAGCAVVGGHTVLDPELKYGLCVIGALEEGVEPLSQTRAQPGDRLLLSKPIGFGVAAQAIKQGRLAAAELEQAVAAMQRLNADARDAALAAGARAATDVTGFGLLGHLHHLLQGSGQAARIEAASVPVFDFARRLVREGVVPGGTRRNFEYVAAHTRFAPGVAAAERLLLCDAQTSGGLLIAVPAAAEHALREALVRSGALAHATIGEVVAGAAGGIEVV